MYGRTSQYGIKRRDYAVCSANDAWDESTHSTNTLERICGWWGTRREYAHSVRDSMASHMSYMLFMCSFQSVYCRAGNHNTTAQSRPIAGWAAAHASNPSQAVPTRQNHEIIPTTFVRLELADSLGLFCQGIVPFILQFHRYLNLAVYLKSPHIAVVDAA
jgi:hypothetical protein